MEEAGENERQATETRRAKQAMLRIVDAAQRRIGRLDPFAALHVPFVVSLLLAENGQPARRAEVLATRRGRGPGRRPVAVRAAAPGRTSVRDGGEEARNERREVEAEVHHRSGG